MRRFSVSVFGIPAQYHSVPVYCHCMTYRVYFELSVYSSCVHCVCLGGLSCVYQSCFSAKNCITLPLHYRVSCVYFELCVYIANDVFLGGLSCASELLSWCVICCVVCSCLCGYPGRLSHTSAGGGVSREAKVSQSEYDFSYDIVSLLLEQTIHLDSTVLSGSYNVELLLCSWATVA